jgi:hypothetical protein
LNERCAVQTASKLLEAPVKRPFLLALNYVHASFVIVRDRVIFLVKGDTVTVLYVRGAYSGTMFDDVGEED